MEKEVEKMFALREDGGGGGSRTKIGDGGCKRDALRLSMVSTISIGCGDECEEDASSFLRPVSTRKLQRIIHDM